MIVNNEGEVLNSVKVIYYILLILIIITTSLMNRTLFLSSKQQIESESICQKDVEIRLIAMKLISNNTVYQHTFQSLDNIQGLNQEKLLNYLQQLCCTLVLCRPKILQDQKYELLDTFLPILSQSVQLLIQQDSQTQLLIVAYVQYILNIYMKLFQTLQDEQYMQLNQISIYIYKYVIANEYLQNQHANKQDNSNYQILFDNFVVKNLKYNTLCIINNTYILVRLQYQQVIDREFYYQLYQQFDIHCQKHIIKINKQQDNENSINIQEILITTEMIRFSQLFFCNDMNDNHFNNLILQNIINVFQNSLSFINSCKNQCIITMPTIQLIQVILQTVQNVIQQQKHIFAVDKIVDLIINQIVDNQQNNQIIVKDIIYTLIDFYQLHKFDINPEQYNKSQQLLYYITNQFYNNQNIPQILKLVYQIIDLNNFQCEQENYCLLNNNLIYYLLAKLASIKIEISTFSLQCLNKLLVKNVNQADDINQCSQLVESILQIIKNKQLQLLQSQYIIQYIDFLDICFQYFSIENQLTDIVNQLKCSQHVVTIDFLQKWDILN